MSVQSVDRAFDIIELLSVEPGGLGLAEIGSRLDLNKSTAHRLLAVLCKRGYVEKGDGRGRYRLGLGFVELAGLRLNSLELTTEAQPHLRRLSKLTGQTVFLAIREGREVVYIDKTEAVNSLRRYKIIGRRLPLHATSLGKALLSGLSDERIAALYAGAPLERMTERTVADFDALLDEIRRTRSRGWSFDDEENEPGTLCVGAPIFDYRGSAVAAVSVAWEIKANPDLKNTDVAELVMEAAGAISRRMGYKKKTA
ncbi:MAG: IclR family transcriptional regulator [Desulfovibrionaceae bacterium]